MSDTFNEEGSDFLDEDGNVKPDIISRIRAETCDANREVMTAAIAEIERLEREQIAAIALIDIHREKIERLERNQMTADYANLARVTALQTQEADAATRYANEQQQRAEALDQKCTQFTDALMTAMHLIDQLITENGRLCAASNTPPPVQLFTAHRNFEARMKTLLGDK